MTVKQRILNCLYNIVMGFSEILDGTIRLLSFGLAEPNFSMKWVFFTSKRRLKIRIDKDKLTKEK